MAIKATAKWKTPVLAVPHHGMLLKPAGVGLFPASVETWLISHGYAVAMVATSSEPEATQDSEPEPKPESGSKSPRRKKRENQPEPD